jgi:dihydrofolate reductase
MTTKPPAPKIAMIAAVARNGVIGREGGLPWRIPSDMGFFKRVTMGKPIVMGRKQFESVGRPLPGRANIVVSRQKTYRPEGVEVFSDFDAALDRARAVARTDGAKEVMIIGGGKIYALGMPVADRLYLTEVDAAPEGDTFFPQVDSERWQCVETLETTPSERDEACYKIAVYERRPDH